MKGSELCLGNDLVWLEDPANQGRSADRRLVERILTPAERLLVQVGTDPDGLLWSLWAAKEAAFKAWGRSRPGAVFSPASFSVEFLTAEGRARVVKGSWGRPVVWHRGPGWVHAVVADDPAEVLWAVEPRGEGQAEGPAVRDLALTLADRTGWGPGTIEGRPPEFRGTDGRSRPVSLSHDGPWVAAALVPD